MRDRHPAVSPLPALFVFLTLAAPAFWLAAADGASAAPKPKKGEPTPPPRPRITISTQQPGVFPVPSPLDLAGDSTDAAPQNLPTTYQALVKRFGTMSPADSMGEGAYRWADAAFTAGKFDDASRGYLDFARRYPRNLKVNDALSTTLLIKESRDFEDQPLLLYARARAHRAAGKPDSAVALLAASAQRYPGAKVRHHVHLMLAEIARARGDHAAALRWAVAGADTTGKNRLAPFALQIAAESSIELGEPPQKALAYYKEILERYPRSPVAPEARARALEIRKRMPQ